MQAKYDSSLLQIKFKFDSSQYITDSIITDNLGKYGFKLDESGKLVAKLVKDSMKTKIILPNDPIIQIDGLKILNETDSNYVVEVTITSFDAGSTGFEMLFPAIYTNASRTKSFPEKIHDILRFEDQLSIGIGLVKNITIEKITGFNYYYIWMVGKYKNIDKTKSFKTDKIIFLNLSGKNFGNIGKLSISIFKDAFNKHYQRDFEKMQ